jgi:hypothetical protein
LPPVFSRILEVQARLSIGLVADRFEEKRGRDGVERMDDAFEEKDGNGNMRVLVFMKCGLNPWPVFPIIARPTNLNYLPNHDQGTWQSYASRRTHGLRGRMIGNTAGSLACKGGVGWKNPLYPINSKSNDISFSDFSKYMGAVPSGCRCGKYSLYYDELNYPTMKD